MTAAIKAVTDCDTSVKRANPARFSRRTLKKYLKHPDGKINACGFCRLLGSTPLGFHCILIYFAFNAVTGLLPELFRAKRSPFFFVGRQSEINRLLGHRGSSKEGEGLGLHTFVSLLASRHLPDKCVLLLSCDSNSLVEQQKVPLQFLADVLPNARGFDDIIELLDDHPHPGCVLIGLSFITTRETLVLLFAASVTRVSFLLGGDLTKPLLAEGFTTSVAVLWWKMTTERSEIRRRIKFLPSAV